MPRSEIVTSKPIGSGLDVFRGSNKSSSDMLNSNGSVTPSFEEYHLTGKELLDLYLDMINALQGLPASRHLPSGRSGKNLLDDLSKLMTAVNANNNFDITRLKPLLKAILSEESDEVIWDKVYSAVAESTPPPRPTSSVQRTPWLRTTASFANSSEHLVHVDKVLKEELGPMYVDIPGFSEAFFGEVAGLGSAAQAVFDKCKEGDSPFYEESAWRGWPEGAKEPDVLGWFAPLIAQLLDFAEEHKSVSRPRRRPLAQPFQPIQGSTAPRKLDIGFVDESVAGVNSKCHWSQILVPGELKSNPQADKSSQTWLDLGRYAREVLAAQDSRRFVLGFTLCGPLMRLWLFDRLGGMASPHFDIHEDGLQFVSAVLGFLWLNEEQLGFDPTIVAEDGKRYIEIERNNRSERLVIDKVIRRVSSIAGRATTCWKCYREGDDTRTPYVVKDSWQYPERDEEGEVLREATKRDVVNVARYYHHKTVSVGGQDDDIRKNVRKGLDITTASNYRPGGSMAPPNRAGRRVSRKDRSSSVTGQKRSSSCTGARLPPSKRPCSSSPTKWGEATANRVHRRVIVRDYGKPIYEASSLTDLLAALEGCIEGYESLYTQAGILQGDISPNNLMVNEDEANSSWPAFLIDLDLAIKVPRDRPSGARGKTGTRAFMAIGVLLDDESHSFMHDLESFFWVLFWICIHYNGSDQERTVPRFEKWNYLDTEELADSKKGVVGDERDFLGTMERNFTPSYQSLAPYVNRLRKKVFPGGGRWRDENPKLPLEMREILRTAQEDLKGLEK
ncbi:hypothetical protein B0J11DRAFT_449461 [Dendryphion nanum]|uniref:Fungal-type protein kinase domain-containing protein n=1 Tax=Dendryphion nanum TaxID=256645 RepID=A0A9P9I5Q3_9PLEO|nr:hypothetical protein B0J11DRAFT_449461 [Dendryphion nanum]